MRSGLLRRRSALFACVALALGLTPSASAHATLLATSPRAGEIAPHAPARVVLMFDEPVETSTGSLRVYDGAGDRVDRGAVRRPDPQHVVIALEDVLRRGTYTVAWHVVSVDSDPISGAFVFHVERAGAHPGGIAAEVLVDTPRTVSVAYDVARFLEYTLLFLCVGGMLALAVVLDEAPAPIRRRLFAVVAVLALALLVVSLAELVLQGAAAGALGLRAAASSDVAASVARTRFGEVALLRAVVASVLAVVAVGCARRERSSGVWIALLLAIVLLATPVAVSHASVTGRLATAADAAHIGAAAAWTGGLAFLVAALVLARGERWQLATRAVPRFSKLAVLSVAVLISGGIVNGYLQVRTWSALWDTTYGRLLLAKIALLAPLLALGAYNNRYAVPQLRDAIASAAEQRRFLRTVSGELALMTGIVAVTAVLVSAPPARTHNLSARPHRGQVQLGPYLATVRVTPARAGANALLVDFAHAEVPVAVRVAATLESNDIGPLRSRLQHTTHNRFVTRAAQFPVAGLWSLRLEARRSPFELYASTVRVRIAPAR